MRMYWFAAGLMLAGCGTQPETGAMPGPQPAAAPAPAEPPHDGRPVIVAFGDSLSAGFGVDPGRSYPDFLQKALDRGGRRYRVVNAGISGDTSSNGLDRLEHVIALRPAIVIVEFGANDGLRGLPVAGTRANLEQIITRLQQAGVRVVLAGMTLPPNYGPDYIRSFSRMYTDLAKQYKVALVPFLLEGVGGDKRYMQPDGLHPNVEGNRRVAENVMRTLDRVIERP
jgi:acyl-CoA thioesterase-1